MEKNKYYTPELNEFHKGFIFEMMSSYGWVSQTYPNIRETHFLMKEGDTLSKIESILPSLRVKCLNKSDIESCGFEYNPINGNERFTINKNSSIGHYHVWKQGNNITIWDVIAEPLMFSEIVKNIEIKNINEFKKLLSQSNIDYNENI